MLQLPIKGLFLFFFFFLFVSVWRGKVDVTSLLKKFYFF